MGRRKITDPDARACSRARRREQTRDAMQRLRERQHLAEQELRREVLALETTHTRLLRQLEARQFTSGELLWPLPSLQLDEATQLMRTLVAENAQLQQAVDTRQRWADHVALLLKYSTGEASPGDDDAQPFTLLDFVSPPRLTEAHAMQLMLIHHKKREALTKQWLSTKRAPPASEFLGWEVLYFPHGRFWNLKFTKMFRNVSALEVSQRAWSHAQRLTGYRTRLPSRRIVQRINDNAFVFARWTAEQDHFIQSHRVFYVLRFRVEEPDGSVGIGLQTVPDDRAGHAFDEQKTFLCEDECLYIKLTPVRDEATGEAHCAAEFSGRTQFGDAAFAQRNALELVLSLANWEEKNVTMASKRCVW